MVRGRRPGDRGMVKAPRPIPDAVRATQARASDPAASTFVSANAGSGKTHVLVQRVIRLLLSGVPPEKILCITFTKAAAANMAERVFTTLGHWVTLGDDALNDAIREAGIAHPTPRLRKAARKLFASRAGDAGRTEGADHSRAVHAAAAAISVRGQRAGALCRARRPRPERDDGARQPRRAAGSLARPRQRDGPRAQYRDGERRRRHLQGRGARGLPQPRPVSGLDQGRRQRRCRCGPDVRGAWRRRPATGSKTSSATSSTGPTSNDPDGARSRPFSTAAASPIRIRRQSCARRWLRPARIRSTNISRCS